ncbi:MAG TPA: hypothetical protein EYG52_09685 [Pseudomonadales bacterium]|jgi:catechol 2,3-dioxygenase-like lactoylglutathione lyase family enzyme|nr:hypothetical protein [Gammaproteobacteria bacterium]HIL83766.1 hypothetical protein [Pseudomonadales bacterium]
MITGMPRIAIAVNDFDGIVTLFRDVFGMPVIDISDTSVDSLGARLGMCVPPGGSNIELMCPANPEAPLSQSLERFLGRRGEGLFALMLEAPVPDDEAEILLDNGLNVLPLMEGTAGRDIHPNSTHGVLIRVYPDGSFQGQQAETELSLNLSGIVKVMIAVNDVDQGSSVYGKGIGLPLDPVVTDEEQGVTYARCYPPTGGMIELVSPQDASKASAGSIKEHLDSRGEGMYAIVLQAPDVGFVSDNLSSRGIDVRTVDEGVIEVDVFGARIRIESVR